jgi:hypothetical protein
MQSGQGRWFALALRREFSAEAVSGLSDRRPGVSSLSVIAHGGGALVACFTLQRVAASVVAHRLVDGAGCDGSFGSSPRWWWCGVLSCALLCVVVLASACDAKLLLLLI